MERSENYGTSVHFLGVHDSSLQFFILYSPLTILFCNALPTAAAFYHSATGNFLTGAERPSKIFSCQRLHAIESC